jgi:MoaA/NifB/PqqE/SkfB family radical SAM enzyme
MTNMDIFTTLPGSPYLCLYWLTYRCNSKCEFCNIWKTSKNYNYSDAKYNIVKKNLIDLKKIGIKIIDFTGGEPLLNKNLPDILAYAKKLKFYIKLSTNGILYPDKAEEIKGLTNSIHFSLDTDSKEEYKKIRGADGFDKVMESIDIAHNLKERISIVYTVTNNNINSIPKIIKICKTKKVRILFQPCFSYFNNLPLKKENINKITKYFYHPYVRMNLSYLDFYYRNGNKTTKPLCKAGISTIDISPDDCLTVPCFLKQINKIKIKNNLISLYNSEKWKDIFKKAGIYDFCQNCTFECYFGLTYWDRFNISHSFFKQNLTLLKEFIEINRKKN